MITLTVSCSMCGKEHKQIEVERENDLRLSGLKEYLKSRGWIVQVNGDNIDTYCSRQCAE